MKAFFSFYGAIATLLWAWAVAQERKKGWLFTILLVAAGGCLGSYFYEVVTVCIIQQPNECSRIW
jgi:hypothetical protein